MARQTVRKASADAGFAEPEVLLRWPEIVGEALAPLCRPVRVHYGSKGLGATLIVQTTAARAPEVDHLTPRIIERINQFYGYRAVSRIRITQSTGLAEFAEPGARFEGPPAEPTSVHLDRARRMAEGIADPDLRAAIARMGAHVLARPRRSDPKREE